MVCGISDIIRYSSRVRNAECGIQALNPPRLQRHSLQLGFAKAGGTGSHRSLSRDIEIIRYEAVRCARGVGGGGTHDLRFAHARITSGRASPKLNCQRANVPFRFRQRVGHPVSPKGCAPIPRYGDNCIVLLHRKCSFLPLFGRNRGVQDSLADKTARFPRRGPPVARSLDELFASLSPEFVPDYPATDVMTSEKECFTRDNQGLDKANNGIARYRPISL